MSTPLPRPALLIPFVFLLGLFSARLPDSIGALKRPVTEETFLQSVRDVERMLSSGYVDEIDLAKLKKGAIDGMIETLNDPYSEYIPPADRAEFEKEIAGHYAGIGAVVQIDEGFPTVQSPMEDSPAFRAGIRPKDRIIEIDGQSTAGIKIDECVHKLTGERGTTVSITIRRDGETIPFTLKREEIVVRAVKGVTRSADADGKWDFILDPESRVAYIRLTQFIPTSADELANVFEQLDIYHKRLGGLILDLRDNPGGDLDACLAIADLFLKAGRIVSVRGRTGDEVSFDSRDEGTLPEFPMMVLVNGRSASASEILAGSLSDRDRAIILGSRTFGKGLVQTVRFLPHEREAQLKFTAQRYYLPKGRMIHRTDDAKVWGVDPSPGFYVPMTEKEEIALFTKRQDVDVILNGGKAGAGDAQRWSDPDWIENTYKDKQLAAALRAIQARIRMGDWTTVNDAVQQSSLVSLDEYHKLEKAHGQLLKSLARLEHRLEVLDAQVSGDATRKDPDLWPDDLNLTDGRVKVFDKQGKEVAELKITGRDLERWLAMAEVEPAPGSPAASPTTSATPGGAGAAAPAGKDTPAPASPAKPPEKPR